MLSANGKHFTAGLDLKTALEIGQDLSEFDEVGRRGYYLEKLIKQCQDSISALETCLKPVIVGVHSACIGAGIDLIATADIRYCTEDAFFSVKEIELGMAADVGTLQRLPKVVGNQSLVREWVFTGRKIGSAEALSSGLVSRVSEKNDAFSFLRLIYCVLFRQTFKTQDELVKECVKLAEEIANKSPVAVQATKKNLVYSLDHTNQEGLDQIVSRSVMILEWMFPANCYCRSISARDQQVEPAVRGLLYRMHGSGIEGRSASVREIVDEHKHALFSY